MRSGLRFAGGRLTAACRIKALEAGQWQTSDGTFVQLRRMDQRHLVNALLKALNDQEPKPLVDLLVKEVDRRGLREFALEQAESREQAAGAHR